MSQTKSTQPNIARPASLELINEIQQFLYREARLLDAEQFRDWLGMLTGDVHYWMPYRYQRYRRNEKDPSIYEASYFNDTLDDLDKRVRRTEMDTCRSEDPATRFAHVITNIEVELCDNPDELVVHSLTTVHRNMNEDDGHIMVGHREDLLRRINGELKLAKRKIILDQNIFTNKKLNTFL